MPGQVCFDIKAKKVYSTDNHDKASRWFESCYDITRDLPHGPVIDGDFVRDQLMHRNSDCRRKMFEMIRKVDDVR